MPYRQLRMTGERVSCLGLGGSHIGQVKDDSEAIRIIRSALDRGMNFMDNSWDYNDGRSEEIMGRALLNGYRKKAFLMTKIDGRTKEEAAKQMEHGFHFDTAQMPLNVMDEHFRSFRHLVIPELVKQGVGILGMKSMASGVILQSKTATPSECLRYHSRCPPTQPAAKDGEFELFKTTAHFDSTAKHPEWLGGETQQTKSKDSKKKS